MNAGILKETNEPVPTKPGSVVDSVRNDVDQDVFLMFNVVDENLSWYLDDNIESLSNATGVDVEDPNFEESNLMHGERKVFLSLFEDCLTVK